MKTKHAFLILAIGFMINIIGAFFKITHWYSANILFAAGSVLEIVGVLLFLYKLFTYPKFKEFWNW